MRRKFSAVLVCVLTAACLVLGNGCSKNDDSQHVSGSLTDLLYQSYVDTKESAGETPLSYEEWIISLKGEKGDDGQAGEDGEKGDKGDKGETGADGKSAYEIWLAAGNSGSVDDFLKFLKGDKGADGQNGKDGVDGAKGDKGEDGADGVSVVGAYINDKTHLILELSDGTEIDAGYVGVQVPSEEETVYTVTFVADGKTVDTVQYKKGDLTVKEPAVPEKSGYTGKWEDYMLSDSDITVNAVYTAVGTQEPDPTNPDGTEVTYVIGVQSVGGLKLSGVKVSAVNSAGQTVATAQSADGQVKFVLIAGEYTITVDETTLPQGYYLDGTVYKTSASATALTVKIPSKVISGSAPTDPAYKVGDISYDFSLKDYKGVTHTLSEILKTKRAVVINFWQNSSDCVTQLNRLQDILSENDNIEALGVCRSETTDAEISSFAESKGITFPLAADKANLIAKYGLTKMPTTVIIDRYGLIAYYEQAMDFNAFRTTVNRITSDRYEQQI